MIGCVMGCFCSLRLGLACGVYVVVGVSCGWYWVAFCDGSAICFWIVCFVLRVWAGVVHVAADEPVCVRGTLDVVGTMLCALGVDCTILFAVGSLMVLLGRCWFGMWLTCELRMGGALGCGWCCPVGCECRGFCVVCFGVAFGVGV